MQLMAIGVNHVTASVELREQFAIVPEREGETVRALVDYLEGCTSADCEAVILSTCNRTELVVSGNLQQNDVVTWLAEHAGLAAVDFEQHLYVHVDTAAFAHLARVASGLDSMVLGEPQIFGQMKSAYAVARQSDTLGSGLEGAFQQIFAVAKRVRSGTAIGENPVSVAYAAVALAQRIFSDTSSVSVLLIGAGETIDLVAQHMARAGARSMTVANRTLDKASTLAAKFSAHAMLLSDMPERLADFDIVISSTASQLPLLGKGMVEQALKQRKHKPMFMVDIAVPRDIEPQVAELADVYLYTVDDLKEIIDENMQLREQEVDKAAEIIERGVEAYIAQLRSRDVVGLVTDFRQSVETLGELELEKARQLLNAGKSPDEVLESVVRALTRKFMHKPSVVMREAASDNDQALLEAARLLLDLRD
jgi:glutamyl-tRNA reductase